MYELIIKNKESSLNFDIEKFLTILKLYEMDRVQTRNNGGTDSLTGFIGWIEFYKDNLSKNG